MCICGGVSNVYCPDQELTDVATSDDVHIVVSGQCTSSCWIFI